MILHCYSCEVLSTNLKFGDWQKRMQNWINLIACKCNNLNVYPSTKTQQTTILSIQNPDNKYVCGIFLGSIQI